jgi:hypothetical protein
MTKRPKSPEEDLAFPAPPIQFADETLPPAQWHQGGERLADDAPEPPLKRDGHVAGEVPRTVARTGCEIDAYFGITLIDPSLADPTQKGADRVGKLKFSEAEPELTLTSNGYFAIRIRVTKVATFEGSLSFSITRDAPGEPQPAVPGPFAAKNMAGLTKALAAAPWVEIPAPKGMGSNKKSVAETITATVTWTPANGKPCSIPETLHVVWNLAAPGSGFTWSTPQILPHSSGDPIISHGQAFYPQNLPDGRKIYAIGLNAFFLVDSPTGCCGTAGAGYTVIQFIRHKWQLNEQPPKTDQDGDKWNLDISNEESTRARNNESYDPTFTLNPRGTNPGAAPVVYPGPGPGGEQAIVQVDAPGMDPALYARFLAAGGEFAWIFVTFLVCRRNPSSGGDYLNNGSVAQMMAYSLTATFPGNGRPPTLSGKMLARPLRFKPCKRLKKLIEEFDQKNGNAGGGRLMDAYTQPRDHHLSIPQ